jgi:hypothetical protein
MADRLTNIELLVMLSEDVKADNDDWAQGVYQEGAARARRVLELMSMLEKAKSILELERQRLSQYLPRQRSEEPMPKVVQQGPKQ